MNEQLRVMLETYCFYRPDIGYVQGMSFIAGKVLVLPIYVCCGDMNRLLALKVEF